MIRQIAPVAAVLAIGLGASAPAHAPKIAKISGTGVGKIQLGAAYKPLHKRLLLGDKRVGCQSASPPEKSARLVTPLSGQVTMVKNRLTNIKVFSGAAVRGVGPNASLDEIKAAFPNAVVDSSLVDKYGADYVNVAKADGGPFTFVVDARTGTAGYVAIPDAGLCQ